MAASVHFVDLRLTSLGPGEQLFLDALAGTARYPHQYRVLVPDTVRFLEAAGSWFGFSLDALITAAVLDVGAVFLLLILFRWWLGCYFRNSLLRDALGISLILPLVKIYVAVEYSRFWFHFDVPAVLAFTLGTVLITRGHLAAFYVLLPVATLNRETTALLIVMFALVHQRSWRRGRLWIHVASQASIWLAVKIFLSWRFPASGAGTTPHVWFEIHLIQNLRELTDPYKLAALLTTAACIGLPAAAWWRSVPYPEISRALLVVPVFVAVTALFGVWMETRVFGEIVPLCWLGALIVAARWLSSPESLVPAPQETA